MKLVIIGPQGCGKTHHAKALAAHFGCETIVDDWDGETPIPDGALALTNRLELMGTGLPAAFFEWACEQAGINPACC